MNIKYIEQKLLINILKIYLAFIFLINKELIIVSIIRV